MNLNLFRLIFSSFLLKYINKNIMAAILIASVTFLVLFLVIGFLVSDKVVKDAEDEKTKTEYRK